jgi:uncharacterized protein YifE (UPF0438 family)
VTKQLNKEEAISLCGGEGIQNANAEKTWRKLLMDMYKKCRFHSK